MSPYQHGEVYVTEDGAETDLDLGHYERFIDEDLNRFSNLTTGKVYWNVLNKERARRVSRPDRAGHPAHHERDQRIRLQPSARRPNADVVITEVGGTTGDIESPSRFMEADPPGRAGAGGSGEQPLFIHVTLVPYPARQLTSTRSKPTQHSVKELQGMGINRRTSSSCAATSRWRTAIFRKIAMFCNVKPDCVIENLTLPSALRGAAHARGERAFLRRLPRAWALTTRPQIDLTGVERAARTASVTRSRQPSPSASSANMCSCTTPYLSVAEALHHSGLRQRGAHVDIKLDRSARTITEGKRRRATLAGCCRRDRPRRLRQPRHRGQDNHRGTTAATHDHPLPRHLPRYAGRRHCLCPPRLPGLRWTRTPASSARTLRA